MKNILVPIGSVENGKNNLQYAINFAAISGARVYVTCIKTEHTETMLRQVLDEVPTIKDVQVVSKAISGNIFEGIQQLCNVLHIDLMILSPQSIDIKDEVYLGETTGKIVRESDIPLLIVPTGHLFRRFDTLLLAFKNAPIYSKGASDTLESMLAIFKSKLHLLHVVTPDTAANDRTLSDELQRLNGTVTVTENSTVFEGIVEHFNVINPEMLCVLRRKNKTGFFRNLWKSNNQMLKREFHTTKPLLILKERE